jgi:23S rRNA (adenine2503-C2)-methyltransferase
MSQPPGLIVLDAPRRGKPPQHLADLTLAQRREAVVAAGLPRFRADQVSAHWFGRLVDDPAQWTDVPAGLRAELAASLCPPLLAKVRDVTCDGGMTVKSVWRLHDGALVESVLMRYPATRTSRERVTMCVSSQAGCGMNCPFCATGQAGLTRNLSTAEIVEQVLAGARALSRGEVAGGAGRVSNVVFMGMGEPLANYSVVLNAVHRLVDPSPEGLGMSARGVTVSTVGLVPAMWRLAGEGLPVTLALSLHAPDDQLRDELVPVNTPAGRWPKRSTPLSSMPRPRAGGCRSSTP